MLKRLRKEYQSYDKETKGIQEKISKLEEQLSVNKEEEGETAIKKNVQNTLTVEIVPDRVWVSALEC